MITQHLSEKGLSVEWAWLHILFLSLTHETIATNLDFFNCITVFTESFDKKAYMTYLCYISYNRHFCAIYSCAISWWLENSQKLKYDTLGITILNYTTCSILYSCDHEISFFELAMLSVPVHNGNSNGCNGCSEHSITLQWETETMDEFMMHNPVDVKKKRTSNLFTHNDCFLLQNENIKHTNTLTKT